MIVFNGVLIATFNVSNVYLGFTSSRFPFYMFNLLKLIKQIKRQFIFKRLENDRLYWVSLLLHLSLYTFSPARIALIFHGTLVFIIENSPLSKCKMDDNKCKKNLS